MQHLKTRLFVSASDFHLNLRVVERLEKSPVKVQAPEKLSGVKKVRGWVTEEFSIRSPLL